MSSFQPALAIVSELPNTPFTTKLPLHRARTAKRKAKFQDEERTQTGDLELKQTNQHRADPQNGRDALCKIRKGACRSQFRRMTQAQSQPPTPNQASVAPIWVSGLPTSTGGYYGPRTAFLSVPSHLTAIFTPSSTLVNMHEKTKSNQTQAAAEKRKD